MGGENTSNKVEFLSLTKSGSISLFIFIRIEIEQNKPKNQSGKGSVESLVRNDRNSTTGE